MPIKQKEIITIGEVIFQITPIENNAIEIYNISKEISSDSRQIFLPSENKIVTIGRGTKCNFVFNKDKSFSRIHTTFKYDDNNQEWSINDGTEGKPSTNGTWVFCTHSFPIVDGMECQILSSLVKFTFQK